MKIVILVITAILLVGCNDTYSSCEKNGYKGFVIEHYSMFPDILCSNGKLDPTGEWIMTSDSLKQTEHYNFIEFKKEK